MKRKINETLLELIIGIVLSGAAIGTAAALIAGYSGKFTAGLAMGVLVAVGLSIHMYRSIDYALDLQPEDAEKYMRRAYLIRTAAILAAAGAVTYFKIGYAMATFVGIFCLKFGAFLQPVLHRMIHGKEERPVSAETDTNEKTCTEGTAEAESAACTEKDTEEKTCTEGTAEAESAACTETDTKDKTCTAEAESAETDAKEELCTEQEAE